MNRLRRIQIAVLLLPILGGGLVGLRWMHEAFAHGPGGHGDLVAACGGHGHSHHHGHGGSGGHAHCGGHAPTGTSTSDGEAEAPSEASLAERGEHGPAPAHSNCLSCELLAVMVTGGFDLADTAVSASVTGEPLEIACSTRPLAAPTAARARPPPTC